MQKLERWQLTARQNLPLDIKIMRTKARIREWYTYWGGKVYLSFSGGKDSTVLKDIVESMDLKIPLVYANTGLEFPEVTSFVMSFIEDKTEYKETIKYGYRQRYYNDGMLVILRPKINFREVINKYGYPVVSKEQSQYIYMIIIIQTLSI